MESQTRIVVLRAKKLLYTSIFLTVGLIFVAILLILLANGKTKETFAPTKNYIPGVYSSSITLGSSSFHVEVTVDKEKITNVGLTNMDETVEAMYPLLQPAVSEINEKLQTVDSIEKLEFTADNQYTHTILTQAIKSALEKAEP